MSNTQKDSKNYKTVTVQAAVSGWVVNEGSNPPEVFVRWDAVLRRLEELLTNKILPGA